MPGRTPDASSSPWFCPPGLLRARPWMDTPVGLLPEDFNALSKWAAGLGRWRHDGTPDGTEVVDAELVDHGHLPAAIQPRPVTSPVVDRHTSEPFRQTMGREPAARAAQCPDGVDRSRQAVLESAVDSIPANRRFWNRISSAYQHEHDPQIGATPRLWGMYSIPDAHLHALGDITGKRVLELGCGAGQWSRALAAEGAAVVGLDLSEAQLAAAAGGMGANCYPLVQGAAEQLPFAAGSFDLVFCDFGGLSLAPPHLAVPQAHAS